MTSDYVDNWDALPLPVQEALLPITEEFDAAADVLFDRRLNLSFEAAVKDLSIPGIVLLTSAFRQLGALIADHITPIDLAQGTLSFDHTFALSAYDLPFYTPCLYLSQVCLAMDENNVRIWKDATAQDIVDILLLMARFLRPDIEAARVCIAALHDLALLYPTTRPSVQEAARLSLPHPNAAHIASLAEHLLARR